MCGRIVQAFEPGELGRLIGDKDIRPGVGPRWNVAPGTDVITVRAGDDGTCSLRSMGWGFVPPWFKHPHSARPGPINARAETVMTNRMFAGSWKARRCLVPVKAWYEWRLISTKLKQPYAFIAMDFQMMTLGGIYSSIKPHRDFPPELSLAIVTTAAPAALAMIHDRAPLVVGEADRAIWLAGAPEVARDVLERSAAVGVAAHPVSRMVNRPAMEGPELLEEVEIDAAVLPGDTPGLPMLQ